MPPGRSSVIMRLMGSRRKIFARSIIVLLVVFFLGALYLRVGIFPGGLHDEAVRRIEQWSHKKVVFDTAVYIPFHGLSLRRFGIFEQDGKPILRARRITVNVRLLPFLRDKKIMVSRLLVDGANYDWVLEPLAAGPKSPAPKTVLGQLNVPVVPVNKPITIKDLQYGPDILLPENVYIERIEIGDATVFVHRRAGEEPVETLSAVNLRLTMPTAPLLRFEGHLDLGKKAYASMDLTGTWDLKNDRYDFLLKTKSSEIPGWLIDYQQGRFLILREGEVAFETHLFNGGRSELLFKTKAELKESVFKLHEARYSGHARLEAEGVFDTVTKRFQKYRGTLELIDVDGQNVSKKIEALDGLSGLLRFEPDLLSVPKLHGRYKKIVFDATGTLRSFKELRVSGDVLVHMTMDEIRNLLPSEHRESLKDFKIAGDCETHLTLRGSLRKDSKVETEQRLIVKNASIRNEAKKIDVSELSGELRFGPTSVRIEQARFLVAEKNYTLSAFIPKQAGDQGTLHLGSPELNLETDFSAQGDDLLFKNGHAAFIGGSANFTGKCLHWTDPWLELHGQSHVQLDRVLARFAKPGAATGLDLKGTISGPFQLSGAWDHPTDWDLKMDAKAGALYWKGVHLLEKFEMQVRMKNRRFDLPYVHAAVYGGTIGCSLRIDLTDPKPRFESEFLLTNLDLSKMGPALAPPKDELKGTLVGRVSLEGRLPDPGTWRGEGALSITKGMLWQTAEFKQMGHLPLLKVEGLDWVTFEELSATFQVHNRKIFTDDLTLLGDSVDLSLDGAIGLDGALDLVMDIQFSDEVVEGARLTGGIAPLVVRQSAGFIPQYHVGGTLSEPVYEKRLLPNARGAEKKLAGLTQSLTS